jgi:TRAP-type C4-dicarboxylate transport system permease small subunit
MGKTTTLETSANLVVKITLGIAVVSAFGIIALTATQIFTRAFFNFATTGIEELCQYLLVAVTYFGAAYTLAEGGHVRIDFVQNRIPARAKRILEVVHCMIGLLFCLIMTYYSGILAWQNFIFNSKSNSMYHIPLVIPSAFVPIGFISVVFVFVTMIVKNLRNHES